MKVNLFLCDAVKDAQCEAGLSDDEVGGVLQLIKDRAHTDGVFNDEATGWLMWKYVDYISIYCTVSGRPPEWS